MDDGPGEGADGGAEAVGYGEGGDGGDAGAGGEASAEVVGALVGWLGSEGGDSCSFALGGVSGRVFGSRRGWMRGDVRRGRRPR